MTFDLRNTFAACETHGIRFQYPDFWELSEQLDGDDVLMTVQSDGTCFWTVRLFPACPSPQEVVDSCLAAFREEYPELDEYQEAARLAGMPAISRQIEFSCLELLNTAALVCVRTMEFTILVWWQGTDHELRDVQGVLEQMTDSLQILSMSDD